MGETSSMKRRQFLAGTAGLAGVAGFGMPRRSAAAASLPAPASSGIDHIVLVMMENRSFDHYLGWLPGADGQQAGLRYTDPAGVSHPTYHLAEYQGCAHPDPDHSYAGGRAEYDNGACDGWLRAGANDTYAIGYYTAADQAFYAKAAPYWTALDGYFAATMAPTFPNRLYQHSAQTDRIDESTATATMPTIWDRLAAAGVSGHYYFSDVPFLALYGTRYLPIARTWPQFLADAAAGTLPAVSFVDPRFQDENSGTSADDHPHADIRAGQYFLHQVYQAVTTSPTWPRTALVINYDEWGGFFDHVPPGTAPDPRPDLNTGLRGFRTPCLLISPRSRRHHVAHGTYDHTSVLKMIEWRWNLPPLTVRDAAAANLAQALDFTSPPSLTAPQWAVPAVTALPCPAGQAADYENWNRLAALARAAGWPTGT